MASFSSRSTSRFGGSKKKSPTRRSSSISTSRSRSSSPVSTAASIASRIGGGSISKILDKAKGSVQTPFIQKPLGSAIENSIRSSIKEGTPYSDINPWEKYFNRTNVRGQVEQDFADKFKRLQRYMTQDFRLENEDLGQSLGERGTFGGSGVNKYLTRVKNQGQNRRRFDFSQQKESDILGELQARENAARQSWNLLREDYDSKNALDIAYDATKGYEGGNTYTAPTQATSTLFKSNSTSPWSTKIGNQPYSRSSSVSYGRPVVKFG